MGLKDQGLAVNWIRFLVKKNVALQATIGKEVFDIVLVDIRIPRWKTGCSFADTGYNWLEQENL